MRLPPLPSIKEIVQLYKLKSLKQLSQNFLLDRNIIDKIVRSAGNLQNKCVLEIGPGPGGITRSILQSGVASLAVIEKDLRFMEGLQLLAESVQNDVEMKIYNGDVMYKSMQTMINNMKSTEFKLWSSDEEPNIHVIGNLPFNISLPLVIRLMEYVSRKSDIFSYGRIPMTLIFQREVGERMIAPLHSNIRSRLTVTLQNYCEVSLKMVLKNTVFVPKPQVDAAVMHFRPLKEPIVVHDFQLFNKIVSHIFHTKNNVWIKPTKNLFSNEFKEAFDEEILHSLEIDVQKTAIDLTIKEFGTICDLYKKFIEKKQAELNQNDIDETKLSENKIVV